MVNVPIFSVKISGINYITFFLCVVYLDVLRRELVIDWFIVEW